MAPTWGSNNLEMNMKLVILAAVLFVAGGLTSNAYVEYWTGKMTYPGCDYTSTVKNCVIKVDIVGPPRQHGEMTGTNVDIDTSTETHVSGVVWVALPDDPYQWWAADSVIISNVWWTSDGSPCPIPK